MLARLARLTFWGAVMADDPGNVTEGGRNSGILKDNVRYYILTIVVLSTAALLYSFWNYQEVRPLVVSIGLALASFFCAVPALTSTDFRGRWLAVVFGSLLVGVGTWYTSFELVHEKDGLLNKLNGHISFLQQYVNFLPADERPTLMLTFAHILREQYRKKSYDQIFQIVELLERIYPDNGHLAYYEGEIWRERRDFDQMRTSFFRYLSMEGHRAENERSSDAEDCYSRPNGFCGERTAWICHLMAGDFYDQGLHAKTIAEKAVFFGEAEKFLECENRRFPSGFVQDEPPKFRPTGVIKASVQQQSKLLRPDR
jgi:hypothetical protein